MLKKTLMIVAALSIPAGVGAQSLENLRVHGYLTQGIGQSDGLPVYGIGEDLTADYRKVALQFRYGATDNSALVVQIGNNRMNTSLLSQETVQLDWGFFEYRFGSSAIRLGRSPLVSGIYNEIRSVGTLLPFYRAPGSYYIEGKETIDGVQANSILRLGAWEVEPSLGFGTVRIKLVDPFSETQSLMTYSMEPATTGWLWLNTPIHGLRFGGGFEWWRDEGLDQETYNASNLSAAAEGAFERFAVRGEAHRLQMADGMIVLDGAYVQAGFAILPEVWVNGQAEFAETDMDLGVFAADYEQGRDLGLSINWKPNPFFVVKLEAHEARGYMFDGMAPFPAPREEGTYFMASVSTAF